MDNKEKLEYENIIKEQREVIDRYSNLVKELIKLIKENIVV
jgi:hypothetical protein